MATTAPYTAIPFGAILQSLTIDGTNIVNGFPTQEDYQKHNTPFFGATVGRVANRLENATLASLNGGRAYKLAANDRTNTLHGGRVGWDKKLWKGPLAAGVRQVPGVPGFKGGESVRFTLVSPDGDEGFPGEVEVSVVYTSGKQAVEGGKEATVVAVEYEAKLVGGADETAINMTNHSYFNITGKPTIEGTQLEIATNKYLPVNQVGIPTGEIKAYPKFEANKPFTLGPKEPTIDDNFVLDPSAAGSVPIDTRALPLTKLVTAYHPGSKVHFEVHSTEPAFQVYTGEGVDVPAAGGLAARGARAGFCVEAHRYVNAINRPEWKGQMLLKKGQTYGMRIVYKGWKA